MKRWPWIVGLAAFAACFFCWIKSAPTNSPPQLEATPAGTNHGLLPEPPAPLPLRPHPQAALLANKLNAPDGDPAQDVVILHNLIVQYQRALQNRQGTPIGDDIDLARALTGRNPMRQIFLPPTPPALSADGHLRDRWGTPYFLHPRGGKAIEVRSAGPDRKMFTEDDLVANPTPQR